jgi:hypothetical protein
MREYPESAIERAMYNAENWLSDNADGYPRSWAQEEANTKYRGYDLYDDFEAPPIAGYEALERAGKVSRLETATACEQERVHFRRVDDLGQASRVGPVDT